MLSHNCSLTGWSWIKGGSCGYLCHPASAAQNDKKRIAIIGAEEAVATVTAEDSSVTLEVSSSGGGGSGGGGGGNDDDNNPRQLTTTEAAGALPPPGTSTATRGSGSGLAEALNLAAGSSGGGGSGGGGDLLSDNASDPELAGWVEQLQQEVRMQPSYCCCTSASAGCVHSNSPLMYHPCHGSKPCPRLCCASLP
jgi:hypothetical protein